MALKTIPMGKIKLGNIVYTSAANAYNHKNPRPLASKYRGKEMQVEKLHKFAGVNCVAQVKGIGFFAASQISWSTSTPAPAPTPTPSLPAGYASKNFKYSEFECGCKRRYCDGRGGIPLATWQGRVRKLAEVLEKGRALAGKPVQIKSGTRCKTWNKNQGGVGGSQHLMGEAADVNIVGMNSASIWLKVNTNGGTGTGGGHFPHVDVRGYRTTWKY